MKLTRPQIIDLPKSHYRIINAPAPPRWVVTLTMVVIVATALVWAIGG
ncbi:MAG: hypothetical protein BroJett011_62170 [Chloroflexota bacterium]|nr:MAG: hypothetical protein BroJett011_62170 [Chloroflexota bacterium]